MYLYYIMSWQSLSATNDIHKNSKLSAKKVIVKNIVISQETTLGSIDSQNIEYTRNDYSGNSLTIEETLRAPDISLNRIRALNQEDTSGVVKFVRPIVAPAAALEGLRAYDASFSKTDVSYEFNVTRVTKRTSDTIEIQNDASFSNHISAQDVCANVIGSRINGLPIYLSEDVSINEGLECSDISVSHIHPLDAATKLLFHDDISASGAIHALDYSGLTFRTKDLSVNDIYGANHHIGVFTDISVNGGIQITEISMNTLGGHNNRLTIHSDLSINGDLMVEDDISLSNLYTTSDLIQFHGVTDISNIIKNVDISVGEIYPKELGNERYQGQKIEPTLIVNGDVSFSGNVSANWVESEFNVLARVEDLQTLIANTSNYDIGTLVQLPDTVNTNQINIFIKTNKESWYKLKSTNATPLFTMFSLSYDGSILLTGDFSGDITNTNPAVTTAYSYFPEPTEFPDVSVGLQQYKKGGGFVDYDEVVFYVKKIKDEENKVYFFDISASDQEVDDISFSLLKSHSQLSDFSYQSGAGWELKLPDDNINERDISRIHIKVPINNGFDVSFIVKADDKISTFNDKLITIKKINEVPVWKHMILEASNYQYIRDEGYDIASDASFNTEEWYSIHNPTYLNYYDINPILPIDYSNNTQNITDDVSYTFNVRYYNPARFNGDTSYYILDLSSLDPEGFDVCYEIQTANNDYLTHDWSWNLDGSKVYIKVPGENNSNPEDLDFSFEIISHDNSVEDVSGFVPTDYYSFNGEDVSKRIVNFHKEIFKPELLNINVDVFNHNIIQTYYDGCSNIISEFVDKDYQVSNNTVTLYLNYPNIHDTEDISYIITFNYNKTQGFNLTSNISQNFIINATNFNYTLNDITDSEVKFISTINPFTEIALDGEVKLYEKNIYVTSENTDVSSSTIGVIIKLKQYYYINNFRYRINTSDNIYTDNYVIDLNSGTFKTDFYLDTDPTIDFIANLKTFYNTGSTEPVINYTTTQSGIGQQDIIQTFNYSDIFPKFSSNTIIIPAVDPSINSMGYLSNEVTVKVLKSERLQEYKLNSFLEILPAQSSPIYKEYKFKMPNHYISYQNPSNSVDHIVTGTNYVVYRIKTDEEAIIDMKRIKYNTESDFISSDNFIKIWRISKGQQGGDGGAAHVDTHTIDYFFYTEYFWYKIGGGGGAGGKRGELSDESSYRNVEKLHFKADNSIDITQTTSWNGDTDSTTTTLSEYVLPRSSGMNGKNGSSVPHEPFSQGGRAQGGVAQFNGAGNGSPGGPATFVGSTSTGGDGGTGQTDISGTFNYPIGDNQTIVFQYQRAKGGKGGKGGTATTSASAPESGQDGLSPDYNRIVIIKSVSSTAIL